MDMMPTTMLEDLLPEIPRLVTVTVLFNNTIKSWSFLNCWSLKFDQTQVSSSQNLQTIDSVPGSLFAGAGRMVGTLHQVKEQTKIL